MKILIPKELIRNHRRGMVVFAEVDFIVTTSEFGGGAILERNVPLCVDSVEIVMDEPLTLSALEIASIVKDAQEFCLETEMGESAVN